MGSEALQKRYSRQPVVLGLLLILLVGLGMRGFNLGAKSFWIDEIITAEISRKGFSEAIRFAKDDVTPPLSYIWTVPIATETTRESLIRLPSLTFGLLGIGAMFWFGCGVLATRRVGLVAAMLMVFSPFHVHHSQDARMYAAFIALTVLALGCEYRFWDVWTGSAQRSRKGTSYLIGWVVVTTANLYTTYFAFFVLGGQGLHVIYRLWKQRLDEDRWSLWLRWGVASIVVGVAYLPWMPALLAFIQGNAGEVSPNVMFGWRMFKGAITKFGPRNPAGNLLYNLLALTGLVVSGRLARLFLFQAVLPLTYLFAFAPSHFFAGRYLSFLLPVYYVLIAAGLVQAVRWLRHRGVLAATGEAKFWVTGVVLLVVVCWPGLSRYYRYEKQNWRDASAFLRSHVEQGDRVVTGANSVDGCLYHYLRRDPPKVRLRFVPHVRKPEQLLEQLTKPGRIWFVHAWRSSTPRALREIVRREFELQDSYSALTSWGEVYVYLRDPGPR